MAKSSLALRRSLGQHEDFSLRNGKFSPSEPVLGVLLTLRSRFGEGGEERPVVQVYILVSMGHSRKISPGLSLPFSAADKLRVGTRLQSAGIYETKRAVEVMKCFLPPASTRVKLKSASETLVTLKLGQRQW